MVDNKEKKKVSLKFPNFVGRPKPSAPRAGYKASGSRYKDGGKLSRKKTV